MGEAVGVATNSKGNFLSIHEPATSYVTMGTSRAFATRRRAAIRVRSKGKFIREIGQGLYGFVFAHAVRIDPQDNIWVV